MDPYSRTLSKNGTGGQGLLWMQLIFMLLAVALGTFAVVTALRSALNKDAVA